MPEKHKQSYTFIIYFYHLQSRLDWQDVDRLGGNFRKATKLSLMLEVVMCLDNLLFGGDALPNFD